MQGLLSLLIYTLLLSHIKDADEKKLSMQGTRAGYMQGMHARMIMIYKPWPKTNRAIILILCHLKEPNIPYFVWKNQSKRTIAARVMAIVSFDDARSTIVLTLNSIIWGILPGGPQNQKIQKF